MFSNFEVLHNSIGFDGIDIDLENAWGPTPDAIVCGLRKFFQLLSSKSYVVSLAPQTTALYPEVRPISSTLCIVVNISAPTTRKRKPR